MQTLFTSLENVLTSRISGLPTWALILIASGFAVIWFFKKKGYLAVLDFMKKGKQALGQNYLLDSWQNRKSMKFSIDTARVIILYYFSEALYTNGIESKEEATKRIRNIINTTKHQFYDYLRDFKVTEEHSIMDVNQDILEEYFQEFAETLIETWENNPTIITNEQYNPNDSTSPAKMIRACIKEASYSTEELKFVFETKASDRSETYLQKHQSKGTNG